MVPRLHRLSPTLWEMPLSSQKKGSIAIRSKVINKTGDQVELRVEVADTGAGIPEEDHQSIFTEFEQSHSQKTSKHKGTGLGLAICKKLVELMGGKIGVHSKPGKGSTFWFTLKAKAQSLVKVSSTLATTKNSISDDQLPKLNLNVLLADDNQVNIKVAELMLQKFGCKVTSVLNGKEAINKFKKQRFDLVLLDIQMPVMDGIEATQKLRAMKTNLPPIIGLSANAMEGDAQRFIKMGMDDYLCKPVTVEAFKQKLVNWFPHAS